MCGLIIPPGERAYFRCTASLPRCLGRDVQITSVALLRDRRERGEVASGPRARERARCGRPSCETRNEWQQKVYRNLCWRREGYLARAQARRRSGRGAVATVDAEVGAGDKRRRVAEEEDGRAHKVLGLQQQMCQEGESLGATQKWRRTVPRRLRSAPRIQVSATSGKSAKSWSVMAVRMYCAPIQRVSCHSAASGERLCERETETHARGECVDADAIGRAPLLQRSMSAPRASCSNICAAPERRSGTSGARQPWTSCTRCKSSRCIRACQHLARERQCEDGPVGDRARHGGNHDEAALDLALAPKVGGRLGRHKRARDAVSSVSYELTRGVGESETHLTSRILRKPSMG